MKYCNDCKRFSPEQNLFCSTCGSSFGIKLCQPHQHPNSSDAAYCHSCGTRRFSRPHRLKTPSTRSRFLVVGLVSFVLALVIALPFFLFTDGELPLQAAVPVVVLAFLLLLPGPRRNP